MFCAQMRWDRSLPMLMLDLRQNC